MPELLDVFLVGFSEFLLDVFLDVFADDLDLTKTKSKLTGKIQKSENPGTHEQQCILYLYVSTYGVLYY